MSKKIYTLTYGAKFRERAIQLFQDNRAEYASANKGCDAGQRAGPTSEERTRIKELEPFISRI